MTDNNRNPMRQIFLDCWQLKHTGQPLDAMQSIIASIIELHPEYHTLLEDPSSLEKDFSIENGENNPFLHLSMHIALHEQLSGDRPAGIKNIYRQLCHQYASAHKAEHAMMDCLGEILWQAQRNSNMPDETAYLHCLKKLEKC